MCYLIKCSQQYNEYKNKKKHSAEQGLDSDHLPRLRQNLMTSDFGHESLKRSSSLFHELGTKSPHGLLFWQGGDDDSRMIMGKNRV